MTNIISLKKATKKATNKMVNETKNALVDYLTGIEKETQWRLLHDGKDNEHRKKISNLHYPTIIEMWKGYKREKDESRWQELEYVLFESYNQVLSIDQIFLFNFANSYVRSQVFRYFKNISDGQVEVSFNFLHKFIYDTSLKLKIGRDRDNKLKKAQVLLVTHCPQLLTIKEIFDLPFLSSGIGRHIERAVLAKRLIIGDNDKAIVNFYAFDPSAQKMKKMVAKKIKKIYSI